jgi:hypothetical protein
MWLFPLMLGLLACGEDEAPAPQPPKEAKAKAKAEVEEAPEEAEAEEEEEEEAVEEAEAPWAEPTDAAGRLSEGRKLARGGKHDKALALLEAAAGESGDDAVGALLAQEAAAAGKAGEVLARMTEKPGGLSPEGFLVLRTRLAVAAGNGAAVADAVKKIVRNDEAKAALVARAVMAGAPRPDNLDESRPGDALVMAAAAGGGGKPLLDKADVKAWEALALRGELKAKLGDDAGARADWEAAMKAGGDKAAGAVAPLLAGLNKDPAAAAELWAKAAKGALASDNGTAAGAAAEAAADLYLGLMDPNKALMVTSELNEDNSGSSWYGNGQIQTVVARVALAAGDPYTALDAARHAAAGFHAFGMNAEAAEAAWYVADAGYRAGRAEPVAAAVANAGANADAVAGMHALIVGRPQEAYSKLKGHKIDGLAGAYADLYTARAALFAGEDPAPWGKRAGEKADLDGYLPSRLEVHLDNHSLCLAAGSGVDEALRGLEVITETDGAATPQLRGEIAARRILSGEAGVQVPPELGADAAAWNALGGGKPAGDTDHPIALWSAARRAVREKNTDKLLERYTAATGGTPVHRRGPWTPVSVLDGSAGPGVEADLATLAAMKGPMAALAALRLHEWWHARAAMDAAFAAGDDPAQSLSRADREALHGAFQKLRSTTLLWLAGVADAPAAERKALAEAEARALEDKGFARAIPSFDSDLATLQERLDGMAVVSVRLGNDAGEMVVVTDKKVRIQPMPDFKEVATAARAMRKELSAAAAAGHPPVSPTYGDTVRKKLLDPLAEDLQGIGRYLIIPDGPLWGFSLGALPEQQLGRRFMADIRTITVGVTVATSFRTHPEAPASYNPDFFGISPKESASDDESSLKMPTEVENAGRLFGGGLKKVLTGSEGTAEAYLAAAKSARYLHASDVGTGDRGALVFADGEVTLADIRDVDVVAQIAIVSGEANQYVSLRRIQALESAGAGAVLLSTWMVNDNARGKLLYSFYDSRNREYPPGRSLGEARRSLKETDGDNNYFQPSWWGQYILAGQP